MNKLLLGLAFLSLLLSAQAYASNTKHDWKTGTLIAVESDNDTIHTRLLTYKIDDGQMIWVASRTMYLRDKPLNVTVNAPIKFTVEGNHVFVLDDNQKEHKLTLEHKI